MADIKLSHREISIAELERALAEELAVDLAVQLDAFLDEPTAPGVVAVGTERHANAEPRDADATSTYDTGALALPTH